jgi:hypothetical protein
VASVESLIAHNTIVDCLSGAIGAPAPGGSRPHSPSRNVFRNNVFSGVCGILLDSRYMVDSVIERNLFHATEGALAGDTGTDAVLADPRLEGEGWLRTPAADSPAVDAGLSLPAVAYDRWQRHRPGGGASDLGADERNGGEGADGPLRIPPVPPRPLIAPELYRGAIRYAQNPEHPAQGWDGAITEKEGAFALGDGEATLQQPVPTDFFLQWEYRPAAYASCASLTFAADGAGQGYTLEWGGVVAKDGKPAGVIRLRKGAEEEPVADAADVVLYYQNFRFQKWMGRTVDERAEPTTWYRFTLLKKEGRMILLLGPARQGSDPGFPVLIWEDHDAPLTGTGLRIAQRGGGSWRNVAVADYEYTGDRIPPAPEGLTAQAAGGGRVTLRWEGNPATAGLSYTIHRATETDFAPAATNLVGSVAGRSEWHDMDVRPQQTYVYLVYACNALGMRSKPASATVVTGTGGAVYRLLDAAAADSLELPMVLAPVSYQGHRFIWAPPGSPQSLQEAPVEGAASFRFRVETPGTYAFWGLVQAPNEGTDSFHAGLGLPAAFRIWYTGVHQNWSWSRIMAPAELAAGEQVLTIKPREAGTRLGAVLITNDTELVP